MLFWVFSIFVSAALSKTLNFDDYEDLSVVTNEGRVKSIETFMRLDVNQWNLCEWDPMYGLLRPEDSDAKDSTEKSESNFENPLAIQNQNIGPKSTRKFLPKCGACLWRASGKAFKNTLFYNYNCAANANVTKAMIYKKFSWYFWLVCVFVPLLLVLFVVTCLCCLKIRVCPLYQLTNRVRTKYGLSKLKGVGIGNTFMPRGADHKLQFINQNQTQSARNHKTHARQSHRHSQRTHSPRHSQKQRESQRHSHNHRGTMPPLSLRRSTRLSQKQKINTQVIT